jgi:hypothetical protein
MPISGLLITLDRDPSKRTSAIAALQQHPSIDLGEGEDHRLPIVVDTPSSDDDRAVWDWLHEQPGITFVDVVYVHFDEDEHEEASRHQGIEASRNSDALDATMPRSSMPSNPRGES